VNKTLEDEIIASPFNNQIEELECTFDRRIHLEEPMALNTHSINSNSQQKLNTGKSYDKISTEELMRAANKSMLTSKLKK
jgi:hypothetical protein